MGFILSILLGYLPMLLFAGLVYWLDRFEKEPKKLIGGAFLWGALVAAGGAFLVNTVFDVSVLSLTGSQSLAEFSTGSIVAPFVEETLKALAVVIVYLFFHNEFDSILDGIIYAAITALGFAATENAYYIYANGFLQNGFSGLYSMAFVRIVLVGWQHPFFTAFFGIGLAIARMERRVGKKIAVVLLGFCLAVLAHSTHNTIAELIPNTAGLFLGSLLDWIGWAFMFAFVLLMIRREKRLLKAELADEVARGTISESQYRTSYSGFNRFSVGLTTFGSTVRYRETRLFYQLCGELAHKKNQFTRMGDEDGNSARIEHLRTMLADLSPTVRS
jgi:RsiW-degrading membrane proteinase PrsW (M82 family)